jgi:putative ABC transport system ATP-binding protein
MNKTIIEVKGLEKSFHIGSREINAVNGIDLKIFAGEFISIIGPSGSGKTTLLNLIGCLDQPSQGKIYFEDDDISLLPERTLDDLRLNRMGFIFQTFNLLPNLTALENVILPMAMSGLEDQERTSRAMKLLKGMGLEERLFHKPKELSSGESQRVAIARALANEPSLLLADEPTGNLDSKTTKEITSLLKRLHDEQGLAIVLVTHDDSVAQSADRILRVIDGKLCI